MEFKKIAVAVILFVLVIAPLAYLNFAYGLNNIPHFDLQMWIFLLNYGEVILLGVLFLFVAARDDEPEPGMDLSGLVQHMERVMKKEIFEAEKRRMERVEKLMGEMDEMLRGREQLPEPENLPEDYQHEDGAYDEPQEEIHEEPPQESPHEEPPQDQELPHPLAGIKVPKEWGERTYE